MKSLNTKMPMIVQMLVCILALTSLNVKAAEYRVATQDEYKAVVEKLVPGDVVSLAAGEWNNFPIVFQGQGTLENPITLTAEEKGQVILTGESYLQLAGEHLVVSGLVFKNGFSPIEAVVAFRKNENELANYSRVTEVVIDSFNSPDRFESDYWVAIYGKHNRFDHNHLEGKRNKGVTLAVRLDSEASLENHHKIDHNYFGERPVLGSNGGETLRIGTSHFSRSNSFTLVENNYFERCNGEVEIISNKSGGNTFRGNVFNESRGTLTLRHGHGNVVENNVFFGNGVDHTGGIRVINRNQTVKNNYLEGLTGYRFGGGLVVMNGVPNSPINRYDAVQNAVIQNNSIVNTNHIQLAAGSDAERSEPPSSSLFAKNLIFNESGDDVISVFDDISGIQFDSNYLNRVVDPTIKPGFISQKIATYRADNGLLYPLGNEYKNIGVSKELSPVNRDHTGVVWYPKPDSQALFDTGKSIKVVPGMNAIADAVNSAEAGDTIVLSAGSYKVAKTLKLDKALSFKGLGEVNVEYEGSELFEIVDGGSIKISELIISGASATNTAHNAVIRTAAGSMLNNYQVVVEKSIVKNLNVASAFDFMSVSKGTMADLISIKDSLFADVSGSIIKLDVETDDKGIYNAEYIELENSEFGNIHGAVVDVYRGGTDESTFGPHLTITGSHFNAVGIGNEYDAKSSVFLHGVQVALIENNDFLSSAPINVNHTVGEPVTKIIDNRFSNTAFPSVIELHNQDENTAEISGNVEKELSNQ